MSWLPCQQYIFWAVELENAKYFQELEVEYKYNGTQLADEQLYSSKVAQYLNISQISIIFDFGTLMKGDYIPVFPVP